MKWLVTGCTGLLGSTACQLLQSRNQIVGVSRSPFFMAGVTHYPISFTDQSIESIIQKERPDVVLHCAAITNVDLCESEKDLAMTINALAPFRLAQIAQNYGAKFVFISTDAVFNGEKTSPYSEDDLVSPINVYGASKARAEELISTVDSSLVIRTNMYGFNYQPKQSLSEWIMSSLRNGEPIRMFSDVLFSPLFTNSLVLAIESLVLRGVKGIIHAGSADYMSKYEFGLLISEQMGINGLISECKVDDFDFSAPRSHNMALDSSLAKSYGLQLPLIVEDVKRMLELDSRRRKNAR